MTDGPPVNPDPPTVSVRMSVAGISQDRIEHHLTAGRVTVDGVPTNDPTTPAPKPARVTIHAS